MDAKLIVIDELHYSLKVHWSECSYKVSFADPSSLSGRANMHACTKSPFYPAYVSSESDGFLFYFQFTTVSDPGPGCILESVLRWRFITWVLDNIYMTQYIFRIGVVLNYKCLNNSGNIFIQSDISEWTWWDFGLCYTEPCKPHFLISFLWTRVHFHSKE